MVDGGGEHITHHHQRSCTPLPSPVVVHRVVDLASASQLLRSSMSCVISRATSELSSAEKGARRGAEGATSAKGSEQWTDSLCCRVADGGTSSRRRRPHTNMKVLLSLAMLSHTAAFASLPLPTMRCLSLHRSAAPTSWLERIASLLPETPVNPDKTSQRIVTSFLDAFNEGNFGEAISYLDTSVVYEDTDYSQPFRGLEEVERVCRLESVAPKLMNVYNTVSVPGKVAVQFRDGMLRGAAWFDVNEADLIQNVFVVREVERKGGESSLRLLSVISKVLFVSTPEGSPNDRVVTVSSETTAAEKYFSAWNARDIESAVDLFDDAVSYDDTAFPNPFAGKEKLRNHLTTCANAFPSTFQFRTDDIIAMGSNLAVRWHVENGSKELPFTRGCSFYKLSRKGKILNGIDFVEPSGPVKPGAPKLVARTLWAYLSSEPARSFAFVTWLAYIYIVFFSDGILPGANALQLEQRTWEEVRDLSLNFFLVSPLLKLPFSPVVHPVLEGVFNLLLSWAAMFAGFLSDDRKDKPNLFPMVQAVVGMQLLTSAFLLPYLTLRSPENDKEITCDDLTTAGRICESPLLGVTMGLVGSGSIVWSILGRPEFGGLQERYASFVDLLSIDRVGSSFLVDLAIFGLFQCWLVNDDVKRRGGCDEILIRAATYVPFFGLAAYLAARPAIKQQQVD